MKRTFTNFSIDAILQPKIIKLDIQPEIKIKEERSETPTSTSPLCQSPSISCSSSSNSPESLNQFPSWTQCQQDSRKSRRPYSRQTVTILSWWFHHLPFLTVEEMEMVAILTGLTRQKVKIWWQNRRHSQRGRQLGQVDPYTSHISHLPVVGLEHLPEPGDSARRMLFQQLLAFFHSHVIPCIIPS